jgi:hypothetical protein
VSISCKPHGAAASSRNHGQGCLPGPPSPIVRPTLLIGGPAIRTMLFCKSTGTEAPARISVMYHMSARARCQQQQRHERRCAGIGAELTREGKQRGVIFSPPSIKGSAPPPASPCFPSGILSHIAATGWAPSRFPPGQPPPPGLARGRLSTVKTENDPFWTCAFPRPRLPGHQPDDRMHCAVGL